MQSLDTYLTLLINNSGTPFIDGIALAATNTYTWVAFYCVIFFVILRQNPPSGAPKFWVRLLLFAVAVAVLIYVSDRFSSGVVKPLVQRLRPTRDPSLEGLVRIVNDYRGGRYGFFSSHAANTCSLCAFCHVLFRRRAVTLVLAAYAVYTMWTRVYLGVHYVGDVLCGAAFGLVWGSLLAWVCLYIYKACDAQPLHIPPGARLRLFYAAFGLTNCYILCRGVWEIF